MAECTHHWQTCPVHNPAGGVPDFLVATTCIYGGLATVDGTPWDENDSREVRDRLTTRLDDILGGVDGS